MSEDNLKKAMDAEKKIREITDAITAISQELQASALFSNEGRQLQNIVSLVQDELSEIKAAVMTMAAESESEAFDKAFKTFIELSKLP